MTHEEALQLRLDIIDRNLFGLNVVNVELDNDGESRVVCEDERGVLVVTSMAEVDDRASRPQTEKEKNEEEQTQKNTDKARMVELLAKTDRTQAEKDELLLLVAQQLI